MSDQVDLWFRRIETLENNLEFPRLAYSTSNYLVYSTASYSWEFFYATQTSYSINSDGYISIQLQDDMLAMVRMFLDLKERSLLVSI